MSKVNILHLSDLHFGLEILQKLDKEVIEKRKQILNKLILKLENLTEIWKPNIIVISGDIGFSGEEENYKEAGKWIELILKKLILKKLKLNTEKILLCPGNHDRYIKDIMKLKEIYPKIEDVDRFLEKSNIKILRKRFKAYSEFCSKLNIPPLIFSDQENQLIGFREVKELRFVILNSAWFSLSRDKDRGDTFIGLPHISEMKNKRYLKSPESVLHHPFEWLNQSEIDKYGERSASYVELAKNCDIILSGHTHGEELFEPDKKFDSAWLFKAGTMFDKDPLIYNCEILQIDIIKRSANRLKLYYQEGEDWIDEVDERNPYLFINGLSRLRSHTKVFCN